MQKENHFVLFKNSNGIWYYYVYRWGKRPKRSTGEKRKSAALAVVLDRIAAGDILNEKDIRPSLFRDFAQPFWNFDTCPIITDKVIRGGHYSKQFAETNYNNTRKYLIPAFGTKVLPEITPAIINAWLLNMPAKYAITPQTANKQLSILRQMLDVAVAQNLIPTNPCANVKPLVAKNKARGCYTPEQIGILFSEPWNDIYIELACRLASLTGMRIGEVRGLCREQIATDHINLDRSWADKEGLKTPKSGKTRIVPIPPQMRDRLLGVPNNGPFIFSYDGDRPINKSTILDKLKQQMDKVGIDFKEENLGFHSFRHFFNTRLIAAGVEGEKIRAVIGHESEKMTEHYAHLSADDMRQIRMVQALIG